MESADLYRKLAVVDPDNVELKQGLAAALRLHCEVLQTNGSLEEAAPLAAQLVEVHRGLAAVRDTSESRLPLASALVLEATILGGTIGDPDAVIQDARERIDALNKDPQVDRLSVGRLYFELAEAVAALEDPSPARALYATAKAVLAAIPQPGKDEARLLKNIDEAIAKFAPR